MLHVTRLWRGPLWSSLLAYLLLTGCGTANAPQPQPTHPQPSIPRESATSISSERQVPHPAFSEVDVIRRLALEQGPLAAQLHRNTLIQSDMDKVTMRLIDAEIAWSMGDNRGAKQLLAPLAMSAEPSVRDRALEALQTILSLERFWYEATTYCLQRLELRAEIGSNQDRDALREELWSLLQHLDDQSLKTGIARATDTTLKGWLELAQAYRQGRDATRAWLRQHATHDAASHLPGAISIWLDTATPTTVAAVLPLSGPLAQAGNAVLEGMVVSLYRHYPSPNDRPRLITLDSQRFDDATLAYDAALAKGADSVLGPLTKSGVQQLGTHIAREHPIIALNRPEALLPQETTQWSAMSLAPEDEAQQLAKLAFGQGLRRAIIIRPDTDWGRRMQASLQGTWLRLGGQLVSVQTLSEPQLYSQAISVSVNGDQAEQRMKAIEEAFLMPVDGRPRRRQDFDVFFLLTPSAAEARAIRPLLVFHYSGDVPVFAPASVYSGDNPLQNRDLNGIRFVSIPAMTTSTSVDRYHQLKALGADAIRMLEHRDQALATTAPLFQGATGLLRRTLNGDIERELNSVIFVGERLAPMPLP